MDDRNLNSHFFNVVDRLDVVIDKALGSQVHDAKTNTWLLDFWGDEGVAALGYNTIEVRQAMNDFIGKMTEPHRLPEVYPNPLRSEAAALVCERTGMDRVFFCNSGAEANEAMIKLARRYWWLMDGSPMVSAERAKRGRRYRVLTVAGNFHGRSGFALACNDGRMSPYHRWGYEPLATGFGAIDLIDGKWMEVYTDGDRRYPFPVDWSDVAAVNMAPILGNNVVTTYGKAFWEAWAAIRSEHGVLLMFDDVQAGNGRAGHYASWQNPNINVKPDIMCLGKGLSLGWPSAAMLTNNDIAPAFTPGVHFNTFGGSMWNCHMTIALYKWLDTNLPEVRAKGQMIRERLAYRSWIKHVDGDGMLNGFTPDYEANGYDGMAFCDAARANGLLLVTHRPHGPIRFTPPLNISWSDLDDAFAALDRAHSGIVR